MTVFYRYRWSFTIWMTCLLIIPYKTLVIASFHDRQLTPWLRLLCFTTGEYDPQFAENFATHLYKEAYENSFERSFRNGMDTFIERRCGSQGPGSVKYESCKSCLMTNPPNMVSCISIPQCIFTGGPACKFVG